MPRRVEYTTLNASTLDILNVIRQNASYDYQQNVPEVTSAKDIPKVGEIIYGTPALANQFINALVNRIATVRLQSATFNNPYAILKKGYIEFGETIEDIFVGLAKAVDYSAEKANAREFKRTLPDVRTAFHIMNWRVMYPITIQDEDLKMAFLSLDGVTNLITKIVEQVYTSAEYDEFLLFKYLLIKAISHGKMKPMAVGSTMTDAAVNFRGASNLLPFMSSDFNEAQVKTTTPKDRQVIFMDAKYNAQFDVEVLAGAFNMDKADFMGRLFLIDRWDDFDNERFDIIRANSDGLEEITSSELTLLGGVKAVILDENWFQVYDNLNKMKEKEVASGLYWNYFYHTWKTISSSPFANAIVFVEGSTVTELPTTITIKIDDKHVASEATVLTFSVQDTTASNVRTNLVFEQTEALTSAGIAVQKYGAVIIPSNKLTTAITLVGKIGDTVYTGATTINGNSNTGATVVLNKG